MLERDCTEFVVVPVQYQDRILGVYNLFLDRPLTVMGDDMPDLLVSVGRLHRVKGLPLLLEAWASDGGLHHGAIGHLDPRAVVVEGF